MRSVGQVEISFRYSRHTGPRYVGAGVVLRFDALGPATFESQADWPADTVDVHACERAIEEAVRQTLSAAGLESASAAVTLLSVEVDPIASSLDAFRKAAAAATLAALAT